MFFKFLWKGPDKVTRHSVINSVKNGGLNLKVGTHKGTSPCDWSLRLVPCSVYTKEIVPGTSPLKT